MKRTITTLLSLSLVLGLSAQIEHGGEPSAYPVKQKITLPTYSTSEIDLKLAQEQDAVTDQYKETMYRFGIEHEVDIDFFSFAQLRSHKNVNTWTMAISCPDAVTVNFLVDDFNIPEGGKMFVYNEDLTEVKGAFTSENNRDNRIFPVGLIGGSKVIIEYSAPLDAEDASIHISQITHGYRSILGYDMKKGPFGNSGACNINVNCPEGDPWSQQIRTVGIIVQGGGLCSGALVNNHNSDETPYFLSANHCLGNPANWTYYFNHESATCNGSTGPTNNSISGGVTRASSSGSDMALIELNSNIPASYEPCFAGWNASDVQNVTSAVAIHHPSGDVKKICFEDNSPFHQTTNFNGNPNTNVWYINEWEAGVTEPGSSGSPLFNNDGKIIGVLSGGAAACSGTVNNGLYDIFGRFGTAWDGGSSSSRLKDWLDPVSTGVLISDIYCPYDVIYSLDAQGLGINGLPEVSCDLTFFAPTFTLKNAGTTTLTSLLINYQYNGTDQTPITWAGSLAQNETEEITLDNFSPSLGENSIVVTLSNPNGEVDENTANNESSASFETPPSVNEEWEIEIITDNFGYETYWVVRELGGATIAAGGNTLVGPNGGGDQTAGAGDPGAYSNNSFITETVTIPGNGCYEFLIVDDYADGLCCQFGNGSFSVTDGSGNTIVQGGDFGATSSTVVSVLATTIGELDLSDSFLLYPNPTDDRLNIQLHEELGAVELRILNTLGQSLKVVSTTNNFNVDLDVSDLASGTYILELTSGDLKGHQRFTVR